MDAKFHVLISGRVQGVFFRLSTKQKAEQLGLKGWVRNKPDGNVEAIFEGPEEIINEVIEWCHRGPPLSKVTNVEIKKQKTTNAFEDFSIRY